MNLTLTDGQATISLTAEQDAQMIYAAAQAYAAAKAEQNALAQVYTVAGLAKRLSVSLRTARALIATGKIRYVCIGAIKGYRITELAVRQYLGDA